MKVRIFRLMNHRTSSSYFYNPAAIHNAGQRLRGYSGSRNDLPMNGHLISAISPTYRKLGSLLLLLLMLLGFVHDVLPASAHPLPSGRIPAFSGQAIGNSETDHFLIPRADVQIRNLDVPQPHTPYALTIFPKICSGATALRLYASSDATPSLSEFFHGLLPLPHGPPVFS